jgi:hypothetical protein
MASGFTTLTDEHLRRTNLWSNQLKTLLLDDLIGTRFVKPITDFPDGVTLNIPSLGEAETADFSEGQAVKYNRMDTGNFTFAFDQYKYSANTMSAKFKRDSFYSQEVLAAFLPRQHRALSEAVEVRLFNRMNAGQTASNANSINSADHRWVGSAVSGTNRAMGLNDFAKAQYALMKANVPLTGLCAVVDPSVAYTIATQTNVVNLLAQAPRWDEIVNGGLTTGSVTGSMKFMFNVYGFDVYVSNYLPVVGAETINSVSSAAGAVANFFFSATPGDTLPLIGGYRQQPTVYSEFNKDLQQWEYVTFAEYGFKAYRPENIVTVITDTTGVVV